MWVTDVPYRQVRDTLFGRDDVQESKKAPKYWSARLCGICGLEWCSVRVPFHDIPEGIGSAHAAAGLHLALERIEFICRTQKPLSKISH